MSNLADVCDQLPTVGFATGDVVIEQGSGTGRLLVLERGSVTVERDGVPIARIDGRGSLFGEMSILLGRPATTTVRATSDCEFRVADDGGALMRERPDVALAVARTLAIRVENLSGYLADVKRQFADQADHLGMLDEVLDALVHHQAPEPQVGSSRMPELDY